jgi:hypothetical protein
MIYVHILILSSLNLFTYYNNRLFFLLTNACKGNKIIGRQIPTKIGHPILNQSIIATPMNPNGKTNDAKP